MTKSNNKWILKLIAICFLLTVMFVGLVLGYNFSKKFITVSKVNSTSTTTTSTTTTTLQEEPKESNVPGIIIAIVGISGFTIIIVFLLKGLFNASKKKKAIANEKQCIDTAVLKCRAKGNDIFNMEKNIKPVYFDGKAENMQYALLFLLKDADFDENVELIHPSYQVTCFVDPRTLLVSDVERGRTWKEFQSIINDMMYGKYGAMIIPSKFEKKPNFFSNMNASYQLDKDDIKEVLQ